MELQHVRLLELFRSAGPAPMMQTGTKNRSVNWASSSQSGMRGCDGIVDSLPHISASLPLEAHWEFWLLRYSVRYPLSLTAIAVTGHSHRKLWLLYPANPCIICVMCMRYCGTCSMLYIDDTTFCFSVRGKDLLDLFVLSFPKEE